MQALVTIGLIVAIGAALSAASLCIRHRFRSQLVAHKRAVRLLSISLVPLLVLGGATLGATGNVQEALGTGLTGIVASWLTELFVRRVPLRRAGSLPAGVVPDLDTANRQYIRRT